MRTRQWVLVAIGVVLNGSVAGCSSAPSQPEASSSQPGIVRIDPATAFVAAPGLEYMEVPEEVRAGRREGLSGALPVNAIVEFEARTALLPGNRFAVVTAFSVTEGYASYPTFFPLVLRQLGAPTEPVPGVNAFEDASGRWHHVWQDGRVIVEVTSDDAATARDVAAALTAPGAPPASPADVSAPDPESVLVPIPGHRYEEVPFWDRAPYLRSMSLVDQPTADAIHGYALRRVTAENGSTGSDEEIAVVLVISFDPRFVAWSYAREGAVVVHGGGNEPNRLAVRPGVATIGSTLKGRTVIAWAEGSLVILVNAERAETAAPVLDALGVPGL